MPVWGGEYLDVCGSGGQGFLQAGLLANLRGEFEGCEVDLAELEVVLELDVCLPSAFHLLSYFLQLPPASTFP